MLFCCSLCLSIPSIFVKCLLLVSPTGLHPKLNSISLIYLCFGCCLLIIFLPCLMPSWQCLCIPLCFSLAAHWAASSSHSGNEQDSFSLHSTLLPKPVHSSPLPSHSFHFECWCHLVIAVLADGVSLCLSVLGVMTPTVSQICSKGTESKRSTAPTAFCLNVFWAIWAAKRDLFPQTAHSRQ